MRDIINRLRAKKGDEGFTLIELLVVVVIIGVLVAIAIPVYLNYRQGASDKSAQSDARGAISAIEQYYTESNFYPAAGFVSQTVSPVPVGATQKITLSKNTSITYVPIGAAPVTAYKICTTNSDGTGKVYYYSSADGGAVEAAAVTMAACA